MMVVEGLLPLISPARWREWLSGLLRLTDGQIRFMGLFSLTVGALGLAGLLG